MQYVSSELEDDLEEVGCHDMKCPITFSLLMQPVEVHGKVCCLWPACTLAQVPRLCIVGCGLSGTKYPSHVCEEAPVCPLGCSRPYNQAWSLLPLQIHKHSRS